jgi:hypothetical protein
MKNGCKECKRIDRLNDLKDKLKLKYDGRYELIDNEYKYKTNKTPLMFYDNKCKSRIRSSFDLLLNKKRFNCPNCEYKKGNYKKEITTEVLRHEVFDKFKGEYVLVGQYEDSTTKILFRHVKCQRVFNMTRANFLRTKTPCKECYKASKALGINKAQEKLNSKFGRLFTLHGEYKNMHTKIPITCNNCKITKEESLSNRLRRTCCPNCKKEFL